MKNITAETTVKTTKPSNVIQTVAPTNYAGKIHSVKQVDKNCTAITFFIYCDDTFTNYTALIFNTEYEVDGKKVKFNGADMALANAINGKTIRLYGKMEVVKSKQNKNQTYNLFTIRRPNLIEIVSKF